MDPLVALDRVSVTHAGAAAPAVRDVSFAVRAGETVLLAGPSGSGKSTLALALAGLVPRSVGASLSGSVRIDGVEVREATAAHLAQRVAIVFQDPDAQVVTPRVIDEVAFALENLALGEEEILRRAEHALRRMDLWERRDDDPADLSGGGRQRLAIACALATEAPLIVLDEPTAELDADGVRDVYAAVHEIARDAHRAIILIEHNVDEALHVATRAIVLGRDGCVAIDGPARAVFAERADELATLGLWLPGPRFGRDARPAPPAEAEAAVTAVDLTIARGRRRDRRTIVDGVSLTIPRGAFCAIVGPNGAGKTTLAQAITGVVRPPRGSVRTAGLDPARASVRDLTRRVGFVFQNPEHQFIAHTVRDELAHDLRARRLPRAEIDARVDAMLDRLGLTELADRHPLRLSGGQKRRLSVATALIGVDDPASGVLVLDEPLYGQDRAHADEIVGELRRLHAAGATIVVVTHDAELVRALATQVIEMRTGRAEGAPTRQERRAPLPPRGLARRDPLAQVAAVLPAMIALVFTRDLATPALFLVAAVAAILLGLRPTRQIALWLLVTLPASFAILVAGFSLWTDPHTGAATGLRLVALLALALLAGAQIEGERFVASLVTHLGVPYRFGHTALAALRFAPRFRRELAVIRAAQRVRGVGAGRGPIGVATRTTAAALPLLAGGIRHAERVAVAMDARAFGAYATRTERDPAVWSRADTALVASAWTLTLALLLAPRILP